VKLLVYSYFTVN